MLAGLAATQAHAQLTTSLGYSIDNAHYTQLSAAGSPETIPGSTQVSSGTYNIVILTTAANAAILTGETYGQAGFMGYAQDEVTIVMGTSTREFNLFRSNLYTNYSLTPPTTATAVSFADGSSSDGVDLGTVSLPASMSFTGAVGAYGLQGAYTAPATPEPGSIALLMGMGVSGAAFLARRRK